eukprot:c12801_g2_i1.p1 GENE.c12801_g2_i1~~c12801_g2_i1.p1  ORF type:complete len:185 (-),score=86.25 c12801_g2_i1:68-622(-)
MASSNNDSFGFDFSKLGPVLGGYDLPAMEDDVLVLPEGFGTEKSFFDRAWYNTGLSFGSAAVIGGSYGFLEGMRQTGRTTFKLRMNAIINSTTSRARRVGNPVGVLAIVATSFYEIGTSYFPERHNQTLVTIGTGAATGFLYNITSGIRHTLAGTIAGATVMGGAVLLNKVWEKRQLKAALPKK